MKRIGLTWILMALFASSAAAQVFPSQTAVGFTDAIQVPHYGDHTAEVVVTGGTPGACTYRLQGSVDLSTWFDISGSDITCTSSAVQFSTDKPAWAIRGRAITLSGNTAALTTSLTGNNNDLVFTARAAGAAGNSITIRYVDPGVETATESVAVVGTAITVTLRSVSTVLSTAAQVDTAVEASAAAMALLASVANAGGNDGTGAVIAMSATALTGGASITLKYAGR